MATALADRTPHLDIDPFSMEFFEDPHSAHEVMREAGPLVYLDKWSVYGVARYKEVHAVLNDPAHSAPAAASASAIFRRRSRGGRRASFSRLIRRPIRGRARCSAGCCRRR